MRTWFVSKVKATLVAALSVLMAIACFFGFRALTLKANADVTLVTGQDMVANKTKLYPLFNSAAAGNLSVSADGVIHNWENGDFIYQEEVYGVALEMKVTAGGDMAFALRTTAIGAMWGGGYGYYAYVNTSTVQFVRIDETTVSAWESGKIGGAIAYGCNLLDGEVHTVQFSAIENESGVVELLFQVDSNAAVTTTDSKETPLSITGTAFKMSAVNAPAVQVEVYGAEEKVEIPTDYTVVTVDDMLVSGKLYDDASGSNALVPSLYTVTAANDGRLVYKDDNVEAIRLDMKFTTGSSMFFAMRTVGQNAIWTDGTAGYYVMVNGTSAQLLKGGSPFTILKGDTAIGADIFDGNRHVIEMVVCDANESMTWISFKVDGNVVLDWMDDTGMQTMTGTHFLMASGNNTTIAKLYGTNGADAPEAMASVALNDLIELNFYMNKAHADYYDATSLVITDGEKTVSETAIAEARTSVVADKTYYVVTTPVLPKAYQKNYTVQVINAQGVAFEKTSSVESYLNSTELADKAAQDAELAALVEATKVYCESTRAYFAEETVADVTLTVDVSAYGITVTGEKLPVGITDVRSNLLLESGVELRIYFTCESNAENITVNGAALTKVDDTTYYYSVKGLPVLDFDAAQDFVITDGTDTVTMQMSVLSYVKQALASATSTANLQNVVKALANYNACAEAYNA